MTEAISKNEKILRATNNLDTLLLFFKIRKPYNEEMAKLASINDLRNKKVADLTKSDLDTFITDWITLTDILTGSQVVDMNKHDKVSFSNMQGLNTILKAIKENPNHTKREANYANDFLFLFNLLSKLSADQLEEVYLGRCDEFSASLATSVKTIDEKVSAAGFEKEKEENGLTIYHRN